MPSYIVMYFLFFLNGICIKSLIGYVIMCMHVVRTMWRCSLEGVRKGEQGVFRGIFKEQGRDQSIRDRDKAKDTKHDFR